MGLAHSLCLLISSRSVLDNLQSPMEELVHATGFPPLPPPPPLPCSITIGRAPPRITGMFAPSRARASMAISSSVSAQDLRYMELEKENSETAEDSSPTCVLEENHLRCSDSEDTSSSSCAGAAERQGSSSALVPPASAAADNNNVTWKGFFRMWKKKSMRRLSSFPPLGVPKISRRRSNRDTNSLPRSEEPAADALDPCQLSFFKPSWKNFTFAELENATNKFSQENIIGRGGFAEVYRGCLEDGQLVAIKRMTKGTADERTNNFLAELGVIVHVDHPNTAKLIGVGFDGGMHLVYKLSLNGSLDTLLHGSKHMLDWAVRYKIAFGTAKGLEYLHDNCQRRIIHRDIKAANILLSEDFDPQIGDFGLAKWLPDKLTHHIVSNFEGTFGYLAPEYCMHGIVDEKTDVFAYGVLLLELITGRKALNSSQESLVMWAKPLLEQNDIESLIDPSLDNSYDNLQMNYVLQTAYLCIQHSSALRPPMNQVLKLLQGEDEEADSMKSLNKSLLRRTYSEEIFDAEEYNATRHLNSIKRHRQLALEI